MAGTPTLREHQLNCVRLLDRFHELCVDERLTYYLAEGTLLGAVRHGGFIPWDDDADVAMPRKDYNRLLALYASGGFADLSIAGPGTSERAYLPFLQVSLPTGGSLDIFPLDVVPRADGLGQRVQSWLVHLFRGVLLAKARVTMPDPSTPFLRKAVRYCLPAALGAMLSFEVLQGIVADVSQAYEAVGIGYLYLCNLASAYPAVTETFGLEVLEPAVPILFEGRLFMGPANPHAYLASVYGDYMVPPPLSERVPHLEWASGITEDFGTVVPGQGGRPETANCGE